MDDAHEKIRTALAQRFGSPVPNLAHGEGPASWPASWRDLASRGSCRAFENRPVAPALIETLCALALSSPSKSDLQQRDIVIVEDRQIRDAIDRLLASGALAQAWIPGAPVLLV